MVCLAALFYSNSERGIKNLGVLVLVLRLQVVVLVLVVVRVLV